MQVNTNVSSLNSQRNLARSEMDVNTAIQRLSSGLRINSAKDDAAGLAISNRMSAQIRGLDQASRNANDGISVSQVAEGALGEVTNMLQRMRELAVQSASDSNTASDRLSLQKEFAQLNSEIDRIASTTEYNGKKLLDGTFTSQTFQIGAYANQTLGVSISGAKATQIGANTLASKTNVGGALTAGADVSAGNNVAAANLAITGPVGSSTVAIGADATAKAITDLVNAQTGSTGVSATASTSAALTSVGSTGTVTFTLFGQNTTGVAVSVNLTSTTDLTGIADAVNNATATTGITASLSSDKGTVTFTNDQGYDIKMQDWNNSGATKTVSLAGVTLTGAAGTDSLTVGGTVNFSSSQAFSLAGDTTVLTAATVASTLADVSTAKVDTQANSTAAISRIDGALGFVNDLRATLGATQSRFSSAISNLKSQSENVSAARSRIADTDFAAETAKLTRAQVLQQAGTAMLAQANAIPQSVLSLLRG